jgi:hypothetical protein
MLDDQHALPGIVKVQLEENAANRRRCWLSCLLNTEKRQIYQKNLFVALAEFMKQLAEYTLSFRNLT